MRDYFFKECLFGVKRTEARRQTNTEQFNFFLKPTPIFPEASVAGLASKAQSL